MNIWEAIVLGIVQGLTEFLPVSSSGHLELANVIFGLRESDNLTFTVVVHGATVLSTIVVFWHEIVQLFRGVFEFRMNHETRFVINIFISLIPILVVGLFFKDQVEALFSGNLLLVGAMLIVTAVLLTFSQFAPRKNRALNAGRAFMMGLAQAAAAIPGLSRSGSTISTGLIMGVNPKEVTKFSFLMVLIPIIGMNLLDLVSGELASSVIPAGHLVAGFLAAFVTGTLACKFMIGIVRRGKLIWFAVYCLVVGVTAIIVNFFPDIIPS